MKMRTQHTPLPWRLQTKGIFDTCAVKASVTLPGSKETGLLTIADCDYSHMHKAISATQQDHHKRSNDVAFLRSLEEYNAKFIVQACNSHYELLEALKDLCDVQGKSIEVVMKSYDRAMGVIKKAELSQPPL